VFCFYCFFSKRIVVPRERMKKMIFGTARERERERERKRVQKEREKEFFSRRAGL